MVNANVARDLPGDLKKPHMTPSDLSNLWMQFENQLTPFNRILTISGDLFRQFDDIAKSFFAGLLVQNIQEDVMYCRDGTGFDRYFLGNPRHFVADHGLVMEVSNSEPFWFPRLDMMGLSELTVPEDAMNNKGKKTKDKKIPRPPNAYILYRKDHHTVVKEANPGITNNEISQVLGAAWQKESRDVRDKYKQMSLDIKAALLEAHPNYKYEPRRPSEKKKRMRRAAQNQPDADASPAVHNDT